MKRLGFAILLLAAAGCGPTEKPPVAQSAIGFVDRAREAGFIHPNRTGIFEDKPFLVYSKGGGCISLDYDDDGDVDLYLIDGNRFELDEEGKVLTKQADPRAMNRLMRNDGNWKFTDVTAGSGLGSREFGVGGAVGDYDNDGDRDIFLCNWGRNILYRNNGDGTFTDVTVQARVGGLENEFSTCATFLDADNDGDLDLYVSNYGDNEELMLRCKGEPPGKMVQGMFWYMGPGCYEAQADRFYRNSGDGTFIDESEEALPDQIPAYSFQPISFDVDNDGDQDIFVATDSKPNFFWINDGTGHFVDRAEEICCAVSEAACPSAGMGVDAQDYDQDGWLDLVLTNFSVDLNYLHRNLGAQGLLMFQHETARSGFGVGAWEKVSWGIGLRDFDQDGYLDIFVACGHVYPTTAPDVRTRGGYYEQTPLLYLGNGPPSWDFRESVEYGGPGLKIRRLGRGAIFEDFDGDGDLDIFISCLNSIPLLLENRLPNQGNWLKIRLVGKKCNRDALGARVTVEAGEGRITQMREMRLSSSFGSTHNTYLHWGLGNARTIDRLTVSWPGGKEEVFTDLPGNATYRIVEGAGKPESLPGD